VNFSTCAHVQIFNFHDGHVTTFWRISGAYSAKCLVRLPRLAKGTHLESRLSIGAIGLGQNCFL